MTTKLSVINKQSSHPVPAVFSHLGIEGVNSGDRFSLTYRDGILEAHVKRKSGKVETAMKFVKGGGFSQMSSFEPEQMSRDDRNTLIKKLYAKGEKQKELEKKFGLTQAMISRIVNS